MGNSSQDPDVVLSDSLARGYFRVRFQQGKPVLDRELTLAADLANVTQMEVVQLLAGGEIVLTDALANAGALRADGTAAADTIDGSAASSYGYTRSADLTTVTMANRVFGEVDRFDPTGLSRPCCCIRRTASAPSAQFLPRILQRSSHTPIAAKGRAHSAFRSDCGSHACDVSSGRTASPIVQSVGFRQGQRLSKPWGSHERPQGR